MPTPAAWAKPEPVLGAGVAAVRGCLQQPRHALQILLDLVAPLVEIGELEQRFGVAGRRFLFERLHSRVKAGGPESSAVASVISAPTRIKLLRQ